MNQYFSAAELSTVDAGQKGKSKMVLTVLGMMLPLMMAIYWPIFWRHSERLNQVFRPAVMAVALIMAAVAGRARLTKWEIKLAGCLAVLCGLWLCTSLGSVDVGRSLSVWVKIVICCLLALVFSRTLRNPVICKAFGWSLIATSVIIGTFIVFVYIHYLGFVLPTYVSARVFKGRAEVAGIPLNSVPFASVFSYVIGMCIVRSNKYLWAIGVFVVLIASFLTGSRTPLAALLGSGLILLLMCGIKSGKLTRQWICWTVVIIGAIAAPVLAASLSFKKMSDASEGRWDLWYVGFHKYPERPILGFGSESAGDDMSWRLPGVYKAEVHHHGALSKYPGGYHNEYIEVLVEQGLVGLIGAVVVVVYILTLAWQLAFRQWQTWQRGYWALFGALFLLLRANLELPGLFGTFREPADFLAYMFVGFLVSRFSVEQDYARRLITSSPRKVFQMRHREAVAS